MWKELMRNTLLMSILSLVLSGAVQPLQAGEIHDGAGFFSQAAIERAESRLVDFQRDYGKEVRIETFRTLPGNAVGKYQGAERARYFEKWTRDRATAKHVRGIYVLITRQPGHVEIAVDRQTQNQGFGPAERTALRDALLSGFRKEKYDEALTSAVDQLGQVFSTKVHGAPGGQAPVGVARPHVPAAPHRGGAGLGWVNWILIIGAVLLGIRLLGSLFGSMVGGGYPGGGYVGGPGYGGGGFFGSLMTGMLGAVAGNWLYHSFFGGTEAFGQTGNATGGGDFFGGSDAGVGEDFQTSGGDFGDASAGDFGNDNDFGGGDFGGGFGGDGGDFGGGDF